MYIYMYFCVCVNENSVICHLLSSTKPELCVKLSKA